MKRTVWSFFVSGLLLAFMAGSCFGFDDEGFQIWSSASGAFKINKDWKVKVQEEIKLGNDGGNLYYHHTDIGFIYSGFADWLDLGVNYRHIHEKDSNDRWREERRPHFNIKFKTKFMGLDLSDNSIFEYRSRKHKEDVWRYRNEFMIKFPEFKDLPLQPYVADEVFVDLNRGDFLKNRIYAGVYYKLAKNIKAEVYYMRQETRSSSGWKSLGVLGTTLNISF